MLKLMQSENLKYKRSFSRKLVLIAPLFFILFAGVIKSQVKTEQVTYWRLYLSMVFNWWPVLFIPIGIALLCALGEGREKKAGGYRSLLTNNISVPLLWLSKVAVLALHLLLTSAVLVASVLVAGLILGLGAPPFGIMVGAGALIWLVSLSLIPVELFFAAWKGNVAAILLGIAGSVGGVLAAPKSYWVFTPWSWPVRLMCPVVGVHPNGAMLEANSPLWNSSVIPVGIVVSLIFFAVTALLTSVWFSKREVG
jgi:lantibiotic protection ABC transporter MutE/EpiE family permease subunit